MASSHSSWDYVSPGPVDWERKKEEWDSSFNRIVKDQENIFKEWEVVELKMKQFLRQGRVVHKREVDNLKSERGALKTNYVSKVKSATESNQKLRELEGEVWKKHEKMSNQSTQTQKIGNLSGEWEAQKEEWGLMSQASNDQLNRMRGRLNDSYAQMVGAFNRLEQTFSKKTAFGETATQTVFETCNILTQTDSLPKYSDTLTQTDPLPTHSDSVTQTDQLPTYSDTLTQTDFLPNCIDALTQTDQLPNYIDTLTQTDSLLNYIDTLTQTDPPPNYCDTYSQTDDLGIFGDETILDNLGSNQSEMGSPDDVDFNDTGFFSFSESPEPKRHFENVTISEIGTPILEEICEINPVCFCNAGEATLDIDRERFLEYRDTICKWGYYLKIKEVVTRIMPVPPDVLDDTWNSRRTTHYGNDKYAGRGEMDRTRQTIDRPLLPYLFMGVACVDEKYIHHTVDGWGPWPIAGNLTALGRVDPGIIK